MTDRRCDDCGGPVPARRRAYCSDRCMWRVKARRRYVPTGQPPGRPPLHTGCVVEGCPDKRLARGKCYRHYRQERRTEGAEWARGGGKGNYRARARRHGVAYEQLDPAEIYERDAWTCGICGDGVDQNLAYPDPESASLDHIEPMSRGGGHVPANVQCSHLRCNVIKSDTVAA